MSKKIVIFLIILVIAVGGLFYFWYVWIPAEMEKESQYVPEFEPPILFAKDDYKIEERADGKYIVVEKVGLTCKVPGGWRVEKKGTDYPDSISQYWVYLSSPDARVRDILLEGCEINITTGIEEESNQEIKNKIKVIQENPEKSGKIREGYEFEIMQISNLYGLKWLSQERPLIGQFTGLDIPIGDKKIISFDTAFPPAYKEKCSPIWEEFLASVTIK